MERKEGSKANGFMVTVIIRLAENHIISHRAEGMLGNGMKQVFGVVFRGRDADRCVAFCLFMQAYFCTCILSMKGTSYVLGGFIIDNCGCFCTL